MTIHNDTASLVQESLPEFLQAAEFCISFSKDSRWPSDQQGGCLGYPGTGLLFCIADSIGSYHERRAGFTVKVDGKDRAIDADGFQHLFIFNSSFYNLDLTEAVIKKLYSNYRNLLLHNSALANENFLFLGKSEDAPFHIENGTPHVNVAGFLRVTREAVKSFLANAGSVVQGSHQDGIIGKKK